MSEHIRGSQLCVSKELVVSLHPRKWSLRIRETRLYVFVEPTSAHGGKSSLRIHLNCLRVSRKWPLRISGNATVYGGKPPLPLWVEAASAYSGKSPPRIWGSRLRLWGKPPWPIGGIHFCRCGEASPLPLAGLSEYNMMRNTKWNPVLNLAPCFI